VRPFGALISFEEAKRLIETNVKPINRAETVAIEEALDRVLAQDMVASLNAPPFDRAAMDGYAVKARDTFGASRRHARTLNIIDVVYAGDPNQEAGQRPMRPDCYRGPDAPGCRRRGYG